VIPADIEHVPVEKIVQARQTLSSEFEAFRAHLDGLGEAFARLDGIDDLSILRSRLESMVERDLVKPARELERGLRAPGMQPALSPVRRAQVRSVRPVKACRRSGVGPSECVGLSCPAVRCAAAARCW
jgi:hypothetical protein